MTGLTIFFIITGVFFWFIFLFIWFVLWACGGDNKVPT